MDKSKARNGKLKIELSFEDALRAALATPPGDEALNAIASPDSMNGNGSGKTMKKSDREKRSADR